MTFLAVVVAPRLSRTIASNVCVRVTIILFVPGTISTPSTLQRTGPASPFGPDTLAVSERWTPRVPVADVVFVTTGGFPSALPLPGSRAVNLAVSEAVL